MGTGYTRNDTADNIANGNVIDAADLDGEFNAIESAFDSSSGHTHDGTSTEGAPITLLGPSQDIVASATVLRPKTNNTVDLGEGTTPFKFKNLHLSGTAAIATNATVGGTLGVTGATTLSDTLAVTGNQTNTGNLTVNGNTVLGNAASDTVTVTADVASNLIPSADDTYDLGASGSEWKDAYIDGTAYIDTLDATAITFNSTSISASGAEINHLSGVTSAIQTQLDAKALTASPTFTGTVTAPTVNITSALQFSGTPVTSTAAELNILDGVTSVFGDLNILDGAAAAGVTSTEFQYLNGVTSAIQTQIDSKIGASYTGDVDITGELIVDSYNETFATITSSSGTATINCEAGNVFSLTLSENVTTFTWSNPPSSGTAYGFALKVIQDSSASGFTISWPASVDWPNGAAPTLSGAASAVDQFVFYTHDGGTTWYGFIGGQDLK